MVATNLIANYTFLKGHEFTNNLKVLLGCKNLHELSEVTGIPRSTFSTWNMKDRTSYELILRIHLTLDIPIRDLCLGYQTSSSNNNDQLRVAEQTHPYNLVTDKTRSLSHQNTTTIETFYLKNGQLGNKHTTIFDSDLFADFDDAYLLAVKESNHISVIDTLSKQAISGIYLINIDGLLSMNHLQRLPGKQLAILFNNSLLNVNESDIEIIGKVVTEIKTVIT
ncbi:helix-turn-helix domain-containing protein [Vibrio sp. MA40-2]|uniref:helix-turn-helix domain-containing protein n=1 Tax=Vibrio sp. MA40-2 TaxID=3391828 RepID=UPI0039A7310D